MWVQRWEAGQISSLKGLYSRVLPALKLRGRPLMTQCWGKEWKMAMQRKTCFHPKGHSHELASRSSSEEPTKAPGRRKHQRQHMCHAKGTETRLQWPHTIKLCPFPMITCSVQEKWIKTHIGSKDVEQRGKSLLHFWSEARWSCRGGNILNHIRAQCFYFTFNCIEVMWLL